MSTDTIQVTPTWEGSRKIEPEGGLTEADLSYSDEFDPWGDDPEGTEAAGKTSEDSSAPTTETKEENVTEKAAEEEAPTTEPQPEAPKKLKFQAKVDHKVTDVEMDFDELPTVYQKAQNYSRFEKKYAAANETIQRMAALSAQLGYASIEEMLNSAGESDRKARIQALVDEGTNEKIAADFVDRDIAKVKADLEAKAKAAEQEDKPGQKETKGEKAKGESAPDFKAQVAELLQLRPDLKEMKTLPQEVVTSVVEKGTPLRIAYAEWEAKQLKAENERIRREKELLAQQADSASRAPVRGATDRMDDKGDPEDHFLKGFNRRRW